MYLHGIESFCRLLHLYMTQQLINVPIYLNITASYFLFVIYFLTRLRELCVKLMFLHPVDYGRKAEELLWRKVYYEVIQVIKTNKKVQSRNTFHDLKYVVLAIRLKSSLSSQHIHSRSALECAYRTHLIAGVGFFQHLLLYIQSHYQLELQDCIDWTHVTDPLIGETCYHMHIKGSVPTVMENWGNLK